MKESNKNFFEERSVILFWTTLLSIIVFSLIYPIFFDSVKYVFDSNSGIIGSLADKSASMMEEFIFGTNVVTNKMFEFLISLLITCITLTNIIGYITKKNEIIFISIGLGIVCSIICFYISSGIISLLLLLWAFLNIAGYFQSTEKF